MTLPRQITFQWHITDQCNLRCKHCYQSEYTSNGADFETQLTFLSQMVAFVDEAKKEHGKVSAHINFTGGEPFLRSDFIPLLREVKKQKRFSVGILSNGLLLDDAQLLDLQKLKPSFIQLSLEGGKRTNDKIRGTGSFRQTAKATKKYRSLGIPVIISFTANAENYLEFPKVVRFARRHKVRKVWTDRYLPFAENDQLCMSSDQAKAYFQLIRKEQERSRFHFLSKTWVSSQRALQFLTSGGIPYRCTAGDSLLAFLPNGDILPCRRLPIKVGNLNNKNLIETYKSHPLLQELRKPEAPDSECAACFYKTTCRGGLKCLSHAKTGDFSKKDPDCWL